MTGFSTFSLLFCLIGVSSVQSFFPLQNTLLPGLFYGSAVQDVQFYLYSNPNNYSLEAGEVLDLNNNATITGANFRPDAPVKIIIHGFGNNYTCFWPQEVKDIYFERQVAANVIAVDWGKLASNNATQVVSYMYAVNNVNAAAARVAKLILHLEELRNISLDSIHIIGWSLGAHLAGEAGHLVQEQRNGASVSRVTGLDPAGPGFYTNLLAGVQLVGEFGRRLEKTDAKFVDTIHTDRGRYGTLEKDGQADFYMNNDGLPSQPNCTSILEEPTSFCSHQAAPKFFMQSIGKRICATKNLTNIFQDNAGVDLCGTSGSVDFGDGAKPGTSGKFYLNMIPMALSGKYPGF